MRVLSDKAIRLIIDDYGLTDADKLLAFIRNNPAKNSLSELSRIAELANNTREHDGAYYTDEKTLNHIAKSIPILNKGTVRVLEPSVGVGNFIPMIIDCFSYAEKVILDVCDINNNSLNICAALNEKRDIPDNIEINYLQGDFLDMEFTDSYDFIIGNPPFVRLSIKQGLDLLKKKFLDGEAKNTAAFFLEKAVLIADYVAMIMPKIFLSNSDYNICRNKIAEYEIDTIIDLGESGFKGVLVETIVLFIDTNGNPSTTRCISIARETSETMSQSLMTDSFFPNWLMYRNDRFDAVAANFEFNIFEVVRDRQITNKMVATHGKVWVIKSRNVNIDGSGISHIDGYDSYIDEEILPSISIGKYFDREDVFLSPNMTYYPRAIRKPKNVIVNGSVAILIPRKDVTVVDDKDMNYYATDEFREFYAIARNYSTRTLNIDKNSIYYFGRKRGLQ